MKKTAIILLCAALGLASGCGSQDNGDAEQALENVAEETTAEETFPGPVSAGLESLEGFDEDAWALYEKGVAAMNALTSREEQFIVNTVQEENGKLRLLKYGEKQQDGKVFQLAFHTEKAGTTKVTLDSARMDVESQAITRDAPEAEKDPAQATLTIEAKAKPGKKHRHSSSKTEETATSGSNTAAAASTPKNLQSAKTGDQGPMLWIVLAAVAMIGCIWVLTRKRRRHE